MPGKFLKRCELRLHHVAWRSRSEEQLAGDTRFYVSFFLLLALFAVGCGESNQVDLDREAYRSWTSYLGDKASTQYSSLDQINVENVHELEVAWTYSTEDAIEDRTEIQSNPIIVDSVLYGTSAQLKAFALRADTGEPLWTFDPFEGEEPAPRGRNRGVAYWTDGADDRRIFYVAGSRLYGIDADTGKPVKGFGEDGSVDFTLGVDRDAMDISITASSPGVVYDDLLIHGSTVNNRAPGHIRAYNVRTGDIEWVFHTIPHPGEYGYETWPPDAWTRVGNANSWPGMSVDEERGMVFVPTASPGDDFYGGDRIGRNLFGTSLVALDAATGERIWHYQFVRHDIWDRDLPAAPNLVTIRHNGRMVDAVAQVTKSGHVFVFDRETGEPLFPIEEVEAPPSDLPGEEAWPTQPVPVKPEPFARQEFHEEDISDINPEYREDLLERYLEIRTDHQWDPPSFEGTLIFPGFDGGAEWGGAAFDPESGVLYVNANEMPWIVTMMEVEADDDEPMTVGQRLYTTNCASCHGPDRSGDPQGGFPSLIDVDERLSDQQLRSVIEDGRGRMPSFGYLAEEEIEAIVNFLVDPEASESAEKLAERGEQHANMSEARVPYTHTGWNRFLDPDGYPAVEPPWGTLNAIDLNTGEYLWKKPLGEFQELTERGIPQTGTENYGGPAVTAGGVLFIGATQDEKFRAFDKETGELLWETDLPAGGYATPSVYEVDGRQYVVIAAGGGKMGTPSGDTYIAFSLPKG